MLNIFKRRKPMNSNSIILLFLLSANSTKFSCLIFWLQEIANLFYMAANPSFLNMQNVQKLSSLYHIIFIIPAYKCFPFF